MRHVDPTADRSSGRSRQRGFIAALGVGQIISWGTLYFVFPLLVVPMGAELGYSRPQLYGLATLALIVSGLAAYPVGAAIDRGLGRRVMTAGAMLAGLLLLVWSRLHSLAGLYLVFAGIGLAQAMTLYEPVFAVIVRRFGSDARRGITAVTLWGGFASTIAVPVAQVLIDAIGWRDTLALLGLCNLLCAVLYLRAIDPTRDVLPSATAGSTATTEGAGVLRPLLRRPTFWALLVAFTVFYGAVSALLLHLYPLLVERGLEPAMAVMLIAAIGPSQVAARVLIMWLAGSRSIRFLGMATASAFPVAFLLLALPANPILLWLFAIVFGAANGVMTIVRGLVVPEMLTREAYGAVNGVLAAPSAVARALAPVLAAALWAIAGSYQIFVVVLLLASLVLVGAFGLAVATSRPAAD